MLVRNFASKLTRFLDCLQMLLARICLDLHRSEDGGLAMVAKFQKALQGADKKGTGSLGRKVFCSVVEPLLKFEEEEKQTRKEDAGVLFRHYEKAGTVKGEANYKAMIAEFTETLEKHEGAKQAIANKQKFKIKAHQHHLQQGPSLQ